MGNLRLALHATDSVDAQRLALVGRRGLGLSDPAARSLAGVLPFELTLVEIDAEAQQRLLSHLAGAGVSASELESRVNYPPCARHMRLAASEQCPKCEARSACVACLKLDGPPLCPGCRKKTSRRSRFRNLRVGVLLAVLATVGVGGALQKRAITSWHKPLTVAVYPVAGDDTSETRAYIDGLGPASWEDVGRFFDEAAEPYDLPSQIPVELLLGPTLDESPPPTPTSGSSLDVISWSLKLRYWSWATARAAGGPDADVAVFLVLHSPRLTSEVEHSLGLENVRVAVVHAFADTKMAGTNNFVLAHEVMHMVGATDKYDPMTGYPRYPDGFADPSSDPRLPQSRAEIMGGRIPIGVQKAEVPEGLDDAMIGPMTAREIGWSR